MGAGFPGNGAKTGRLLRQRRRAPPLPGRSAFACSRVPNSAPPLGRSAAKADRSNRGGAAYRNPMGFSVGLKVEFLERRQVSLRMGRKLRHRVEELADGDTRPDGSGSLVKPLPRLRSYGPGPDQDPAILVGTTQPWCATRSHHSGAGPTRRAPTARGRSPLRAAAVEHPAVPTLGDIPTEAGSTTPFKMPTSQMALLGCAFSRKSARRVGRGIDGERPG
jgi:hypothetical protein